MIHPYFCCSAFHSPHSRPPLSRLPLLFHVLLILSYFLLITFLLLLILLLLLVLIFHFFTTIRIFLLFYLYLCSPLNSPLPLRSPSLTPVSIFLLFFPLVPHLFLLTSFLLVLLLLSLLVLLLQLLLVLLFLVPPPPIIPLSLPSPLHFPSPFSYPPPCLLPTPTPLPSRPLLSHLLPFLLSPSSPHSSLSPPLTHPLFLFYPHPPFPPSPFSTASFNFLTAFSFSSTFSSFYSSPVCTTILLFYFIPSAPIPTPLLLLSPYLRCLPPSLPLFLLN